MYLGQLAVVESENELWVASWHTFLQICQNKGHMEYVGGEMKEGKDNLAENKTASFSDNWHFVFILGFKYICNPY